MSDPEYEVKFRDAVDDRSPLKNEAALMSCAVSFCDRAEKYGLLDAWNVTHNDKPYGQRFLADFFRAPGLKRAERSPQTGSQEGSGGAGL